MNWDKAPMLIHILQSCWALMLSWWMGCSFPGKELGGASPVAPSNTSLQNELGHHSHRFVLFCFFVKAEILFEFLSVSENRYPCKSLVKSKWSKVNLQKPRGYLYTFQDLLLQPFNGKTKLERNLPLLLFLLCCHSWKYQW